MSTSLLRRFEGRVAFVTGAARGFGAAFAEAFVAEGAAVAMVDVDTAAVQEAAEKLRAAGGRVVGLECDVADPDSVASAVEHTVGELGEIGILVNNAGLHLTRYNLPFAKLPTDEIRRLFDVNVLGVVHCTLACAESMGRAGRGAVVNLSSLSSYQVVSPYGVSKLAVRGLTTAFAAQLGDAGIRVNAVAPGLMATESAVADLPAELLQEFVTSRQSVHRTGAVEDVVSAVTYLCSDAASFVTGETLRVDGGVFRGV
ncbi:SDR family NAD(P)-dependent oxidoreductase [Pseudonocardia pini]|uniref:SDR family NAD(P)-dependent oxidoreductase n=1 Tax=Pseudonocardia pini TaxID=2758030 RepID=UPI0015F0D150|nr:SDR family oxidoreductase [Pseudonocardia pini]